MELKQIKYFLAVVDCKTFLAASQYTFVTQPTLSAGIQKLEKSLGVKLFHRGSRQASLTQAGQDFLIVARQSYNQLIAVKSRLTNEPQKVIIGVLVNIHMDHVAKIVSVFRSSYPHILIEFIIEHGDELDKLLKKGEIDLAITNTHTGSESFTPLIAEKMCIVVSNKHPLASKKFVTLSSLDGELFIERVKCGFWQAINDIFKKKEIQPHTVMQAENDEFVLSLVAENLGVSIITDRTTPYDVKFIPIKDFKINQHIGIAKSSKFKSNYVEVLYDTIVNQFT